MISFLKFIWKLYQIVVYRIRKKNIIVSPFSFFNKFTILEGNNVIHRKAVVSSSYVGRNTYIGYNSNLANCSIGRFCSIAENVSVISATHPTSVFVSTCPSFYSLLYQNGQTFVTSSKFNEFLQVSSRNAVIGNDVWIGSNVLIKGGITIGDGAIIAMGSVVTKDIPPYAIVGGNPAKFIRYRFPVEDIDFLIGFQWWNKSDSWILENSKYFDNIEKFINSQK